MTKEELLMDLAKESIDRIGREAIYNKGLKHGVYLTLGLYAGYQAFRIGKVFYDGWNEAKEEEENV